MSEDTVDEVRSDVMGGVATITLDRPAARNALDAASLLRLRELLAAAASDDDVRVVVLTGAGTTFCAGADLRATSSGSAQGFTTSGPQALADVLVALLDHPKPTIARVQGHVAAGGNGLVAACDLAVAVESARFAFTEVRIGVVPAVISVVCLARMRPRDAAELFLLGDRVSANRAQHAGLLTAVVPDDALDDQVRTWVSALTRGGPLALRGTKELLRTVPSMNRAAAFTAMIAASAEYFASPEAAEGMTAFLSKRSASWVPPTSEDDAHTH